MKCFYDVLGLAVIWGASLVAIYFTAHGEVLIATTLCTGMYCLLLVERR